MAEEKKEDSFDDIENIEDNIAGGFGYGKAGYDKPLLVMEATRNCIASANCEMRAGYTIKKIDKFGNLNETPVEDGRKKHISCIEVLGELLSPDLDKEAKDNIKKLLDSIDSKEAEFADKEKAIWKTMPREAVSKFASQGIFYMEDKITIPLNAEFMTEYQLKIYKQIFTELNLLLARIKYFKKKPKFG